MSGWTIIIRTALASSLGLLSLAATLCDSADETAVTCPDPVTATVSDLPARILVTDEQDEALPVGTDTSGPTRTTVGAHISDAIDEVRQQRGTLLHGTVLGQVGSAERERSDFQAVLKRVAEE